MAALVPNVSFVLMPVGASPGIIDYNTVMGRKISEAATKRLTEELFDCVPENLFHFLKALKYRARAHKLMRGSGILDIPVDCTDVISETHNLLDIYGNISIKTIRNFEDSYINEEVRPAQDTPNLYQCMMNSVSDVDKSKVLIWEPKYVVKTKISGNLLLKIIVRESHLDKNVPTGSIREKLSSLDTYLPRWVVISPNLTNTLN